MNKIVDDVDALLSDEFAKFSQLIADIYAEKTKEKDAMKQLYEAFQAKMKDLDDQARQAKEDFEKWCASQTKTSSGSDG